MRKRSWGNGAYRLAPCRVATNLQFKREGKKGGEGKEGREGWGKAGRKEGRKAQGSAIKCGKPVLTVSNKHQWRVAHLSVTHLYLLL